MTNKGKDISYQPWTGGNIYLSPVGLRECVLRVQMMSYCEVKNLCNIKKRSLLHEVARWKLNDYAQWLELLELMKIEKKL